MPIKLIAAPHSPFHLHGGLNPEMVDRQAEYLQTGNVAGVFVCGSTGEGLSLTNEERMELAASWVEAARKRHLQVIVHVGHNCQRDAIRLAQHAVDVGADAVAAMAPCYFKPTGAAQLLDFLNPVADAAKPLPFYFYDIPSMTGVAISTIDVLRLGSQRLSNLAGIKYTNPDLMQFQECLRFDEGRYEIWFGCDEALLAGYALGAQGAVGSTYNFAAPLYHRMIAARDAGDEALARELQSKSIELIRLCQAFGYMAAAKTLMSFIGIDCGPVRSPLIPLSASQSDELRRRVARLDVLPVPGA